MRMDRSRSRQVRQAGRVGGGGEEGECEGVWFSLNEFGLALGLDNKQDTHTHTQKKKNKKVPTYRGEMMPLALITRCQGTLSWWKRAAPPPASEAASAGGRCLRQMPTCRGRWAGWLIYSISGKVSQSVRRSDLRFSNPGPSGTARAYNNNLCNQSCMTEREARSRKESSRCEADGAFIQVAPGQRLQWSSSLPAPRPVSGVTSQATHGGAAGRMTARQSDRQAGR